MKRALIIYDSAFGNTERVAQMMATTLKSQAEATARRVGNVSLDQLPNLDLLIVGSPTQAFRPTWAVKNLLKNIPARSLSGIKVAAFDTRIDIEDVGSRLLTFLVNLFGYAAKPIADSLVTKGGELVIPPEGFVVQDKEGPLREGELERAADWVKQIVAA